MAANGGFGLSKSAIFTFCIGIVFGFAFTYFFAFSSVRSPYPTESTAFTSSVYIPLDPHTHADVRGFSGPTVQWDDKLSHSHQGEYRLPFFKLSLLYLLSVWLPCMFQNSHINGSYLCMADIFLWTLLLLLLLHIISYVLTKCIILKMFIISGVDLFVM